MVTKTYYSIIWSYDNFTDYYEENPTEHLTLKDVFKEYLDERKQNRDFHNSEIQEPICYFRIRQHNIDFNDDCDYIADYKVIHHRNGKYSIKRCEDII